MADAILCACPIPGISRDHDPASGKDRHSVVLRSHAPALWPALRHITSIPLLFTQEEDFDLEQKKATHRVAFI